jgi:hypothetical protein
VANVSSSISSSDRPTVRFLAPFFAIILLLLCPLAVSALFLQRSGELSSPLAVAQWLVRNNGIYGTALNNNLREISFALYELRKPKILVMSSSRGVDFRSQFFRKEFGCACSIMSNIEEGQQFSTAISNGPAPEVVILGLDFWWFSQTDDHSTVRWNGLGRAPELTRPAALTPYEWLYQGKISFADMVSVMAGRLQRTSLSSEPKLGVQAIVDAKGTRPDGTWSPLGTAATRERPVAIDAYMNRMIAEPELILLEKSGRYSPDQKLSEERIDELKQLIGSLEQRGSKVVLMLLPIVPGFIDEMAATGRYQFIDLLRERLAKLGTEYYDKLDPRTFGGTVCEFKDPHHGGNALYAKMLLSAARQHPDSVLAGIVDLPVVADVAERFDGRVVATIGTESESFREVDFLGLGCQK